MTRSRRIPRSSSSSIKRFSPLCRTVRTLMPSTVRLNRTPVNRAADIALSGAQSRWFAPNDAQRSPQTDRCRFVARHAATARPRASRPRIGDRSTDDPNTFQLSRPIGPGRGLAPRRPFSRSSGGADRWRSKVEGLREAADCLSTALAARMAGDEEIPPPGRLRRGRYWVAPEPTMALKAALY